jgi:hypothetical protein
MTRIQLPHSDEPTPWTDLIAFLGLLAFGGVLLASGSTTAVSLGAVCAALAGLWAAYKWPRPPAGSSGGNDHKPDQLPPA